MNSWCAYFNGLMSKGHKFSMGAVPIHLLNSLRVLRNYLCVLRHIHTPSDSFYTNSKGLDPANKASATTVKDRTLLTVAIVVKLHHLIASDVNAFIFIETSILLYIQQGWQAFSTWSRSLERPKVPT